MRYTKSDQGKIYSIDQRGAALYQKDVAITASEEYFTKESFPDASVKFDWATNRNPFQRLKNLLALEANWDGYGAAPFSRAQINRAFDLYSNIYSYYLDREIDFSKLAPFIAPGADGAVLFEWAGRRFPEKELEILIPATSSNPLEYLKEKEGIQEEGTLSADQSDRFLNWLFAVDS
jgi:hypothetical protein